MKYLVVECHTAYAVVLDDEGRFLKVVNFDYEVGQMVDEVVEMKDNYVNDRVPVQPKPWGKYIVAFMCCLLVCVGSFQVYQTMSIGTVMIRINPEIEISLNRKDQVKKIMGLNEDGQQLLKDYDYKNKSLDKITDELLNKAIDQGYLKQGGKVLVDIESKNNDWITHKTQEMDLYIANVLEDKFSVTVEVEDIEREIFVDEDDDDDFDDFEDDNDNDDVDFEDDSDDIDFEDNRDDTDFDDEDTELDD